MIHGALPFRGTGLSQLHLYLWVFKNLRRLLPECTEAGSCLGITSVYKQLSTSDWWELSPQLPRPWSKEHQCLGLLDFPELHSGIKLGAWRFPGCFPSLSPLLHPHWYFLHFPNYSQILALTSTLGEPKLKGDNFKDRDKTPGGEDLFLAII